MSVIDAILSETVDLRDLHRLSGTKEPFDSWCRLVIGCLKLKEGKDFVRLPFAATK